MYKMYINSIWMDSLSTVRAAFIRQVHAHNM